MFIIIYDKTGKKYNKFDMKIKSNTLRFSEYVSLERRKSENKELFISDEGTIITRLLEKLTTDKKLLNEYTDVAFDEDIIGRIDEAIKIEPYLANLLNSWTTILYYARHESTILRLKETGLCDEIFEMN